MADTGGPSGRDAGQRSEIDLAGAMRAVWRRKWLLFFTIAAITAATVMITRYLTPLYNAEVLVSVEPRGKLLQLERGMEPQVSDVTFVDTQTEVLKSPALAEKVIDELHLQDDPEFNRALAPPSGLAEFVSKLKPPEPSNAETIKANVLKTFLLRLKVGAIGTSYIISINFVSQSPSKAARIANALADAYLESQISAKRQATVSASEWLKERLEDLRQGLLQAESAVEQYRRQEDLTKGTQGSVIAQRISELNQQLVAAQADYARATAKADAARASVRGGGIEQAPDVINNPTILALRTQEGNLITRFAELSQTYGDRSPKIVQATAELRELRAAMRAEAGKIVQALVSDAGAAAARVQTIQTMLDRLRGESAKLSQSELHLRELEREADARRQSYTSLLARQEEILAQENFQVADARVIGPALIPSQPSFPSIKLAASGALILSSLLGVLMILLIESRRRGVLSREQIEWNSGLPVLSIVPRLRKRPSGSLLSVGAALERSDPLGEEAIRAVFAATTLLPRKEELSQISVQHAEQGKAVLVTSALPGEGKTVLSATMALKAAQAGKKCLLVDCDFRRRGLERLLGLPGQQGLLQMLKKERPLDEMIGRLDAAEVDFIASGAGMEEDNSARRRSIMDQLPFLLGGPLQRILTFMEERYDLVIIDSPPIMVAQDTLLLASAAKEILFVLRWRATREDVALAGLRRLREGGAKVTGIVLSQVDPKKYARYGFVDSAIGSHLYRSYY